MAGIKLKNIHKTYQVDGRAFPVLNGIDLEIPAGKITVILGQSGCGKTTLLRLTGGLESADDGEILWDGDHKTAFVFQEPRLMPWLNVWDNIIFGLKKNQVDRAKIQDIITTVNLSSFEKAYPSQLSGGMQQRAAIARALADFHPDGRAVRRSRLFYERADAERASPRPAEGTFQHHVRNPQHR